MITEKLDASTRGASIIPLLERLEAAPRGGARIDELTETLERTVSTFEQSEIKTFLHMVMSPTVTFGVKALPPPGTDAPISYNDAEWWQALEVRMERLAARQLTGNAAQADLATFLACCNDVQKKWAERALKQDLRLNMAAKEVNKAGGLPFIPIFEVPLATDIKKVKLPKVLALSKTWALQPKLDGARCVAFCRDDGSVELLSRTGKTWKNFESVRKVLEAWNKARLGDLKIAPTVVLDGEVVSLRPDGSIDFQAIQKTMMRGDGVEVGKLHYVVFDACGQNQWFNPTLRYHERLEIAREFVAAIQGLQGQSATLADANALGLNVSVIPSVVYLAESVEAQAKKLHDGYVEQGFEGLMIRADAQPVENKRSKILLKMKEFEDAEAVITGVVEGTGKYVGMLGALQCATLVTNKAFEIGSGFNDLQRADLWTRREQLIGELVSFKFFEKTDAGIPRFPIFRGLRSKDDVGPAPASED